MDSDWKKRILELRYWEDEQEALEYVELVETAKYKCDLEACRILMKTFVTDQDYEVQESVISVLSTAKPRESPTGTSRRTAADDRRCSRPCG